jgi:phospholipase C
MSDFADDVTDGYDPVFTFIEPHYGNILPGTSEDYMCGTSQHPLDDVTRGEQLIKDVYEAIRNSDQWERSVLIITWDEHGGFYDHVPPPAAVAPGDPPGDPNYVQVGFDFRQLGPRVPAVVISPLIERGVIDHTVYDHASIPATAERLFGLDAMTDRDAQANDVRHLLTRDTPRTDAPTTLPEPAESGWRCEGDPGPEPEPGPIELRPPLRGRPVGGGGDADAASGPERDGEPQLDPWVRLAVSLAARARIGTLRKWDAYGRLRVLEDLRRIGDDTDARLFIHHGRKVFRRWSTLRRKSTVRGYLRPVRTGDRS